MQTIKVYHSVWKTLLLIIASFAFAVISWQMLHDPRMNIPFLIKVVIWMGVPFFGSCGLCMLFVLLRQRLANQPYLTITDQSVTVKTVRTQVINFSDVKSFDLLKYRNNHFISIHYKRGVTKRKNKGANSFDRIIRSLNKRLVNTSETISTTCLAMKAEQLCDLLNEQLKQFSI